MKSLLLFVSLVGAIATASASPVVYSINFTGSGTVPTGSFAYDSTTPTFSSFIVNLGGVSINLTSAANAPNIEGVCNTAAPDTADLFSYLSGTPCGVGGPGVVWIAQTVSGQLFFQIGSSTQTGAARISTSLSNQQAIPISAGEFTISSVPEPSSIALLIGGGVFLAWRRMR